MQAVGGVLSMKYGGVYLFILTFLSFLIKITAVMVVGVSLSAVLCFFVPIGASTTWIMYYYSFIIIRITLNALSGLFNAMVCPGISYIVSKWSPPNERTILTAY